MKQLKKKLPPAAACSGMTIIEMMVSVAIGTIIMGVAVSLLVFSSQTFVSMGNYDDLNRKSRNALDVMTQDIRQSQHLVSYSSNSTGQTLLFSNTPGSAVSSFTYSFSQSTSNLTRTWGGQSTVLLSNLSSISFAFAQRNLSNSATFISTTDPTLAKLISVSWICTKPGYGTSPKDTEDAQSAQVVVRN